MFSTFSSCPETRNRRRVAFVYGLLAEVLLIEAAVLLGVSVTAKLPAAQKHYVVTWIPTLTAAPKAALESPRQLARVVMPKLQLPEVVKSPEITPPPVARIEPPKVEAPVAKVYVPEAPTPSPSVTHPIQAPKVEVAVRTGLFGGGAPEKVTTNRPIDQVQTGGFGSPEGLPGKAQGGNSGNVAKLGSFGLPEGPGVGNGTGGSHGIQGVVASAGFGSGVAGAGYGRGGGGTRERVSVGGFAQTAPVGQPKEVSLRTPPPADFQPVEVLSKPSPIYTDEARQLGIQGEVVLSVVFQANGAIRVIGVVRSLGHGLDQAAEEAATRIRFKSALRAGQPADFPATLRIQFRLANQSSS